jgi:hypothetical protein
VGLNSFSDCTYLSAELNGRKVSLQLNTGYQCNVVGRNFIPHVELKPMDPEWVGSKCCDNLSVLGTAEINLAIGKMSFSVNVVVCTEMQELILGVDFLSENNCVMDFGRGLVTVRGNRVILCRRSRAVGSTDQRAHSPIERTSGTGGTASEDFRAAVARLGRLTRFLLCRGRGVVAAVAYGVV